MRTRIYKKNFWFNLEEKEILFKKASSVGMTESDYIRNLVMNYKPKEKPDDRFYDVMRTLRNTCNNLNQIAKKAHTLGFVDEPAYKKEVDKLNDFMEQIKREFLISERGDKK